MPPLILGAFWIDLEPGRSTYAGAIRASLSQPAYPQILLFRCPEKPDRRPGSTYFVVNTQRTTRRAIRHDSGPLLSGTEFRELPLPMKADQSEFCCYFVESATRVFSETFFAVSTNRCPVP
jgi:hypothetical protein